MAYSAEISRNNPSCFLFVIDQSGSMSDNFSGLNKPKCGNMEAMKKMIQNGNKTASRPSALFRGFQAIRRMVIYVGGFTFRQVEATVSYGVT
jgi:hypothetical protein